jgi:hypothetical protein
MDKLQLEFAQAHSDCDRALEIAANILGRMNRDLEKTGATIRESEAKIAKSRRCLYGVGRRPACVLERLPEALARFVPCCSISREQRATEN